MELIGINKVRAMKKMKNLFMNKRKFSYLKAHCKFLKSYMKFTI
jgi:hypothetical protein